MRALSGSVNWLSGYTDFDSAGLDYRMTVEVEGDDTVNVYALLELYDGEDLIPVVEGWWFDDSPDRLIDGGSVGFTRFSQVTHNGLELTTYWNNLEVLGPPVVPIPEPAGLSLLGMALLGLKRKRRS